MNCKKSPDGWHCDHVVFKMIVCCYCGKIDVERAHTDSKAGKYLELARKGLLE